MDYRSLPRISNSDLTEFKHFIFGEVQYKPVNAFAFGSALHELILEPHTICNIPDVDLALVQHLASAARNNRFLSWMLQFSKKEVVVLWTDEATGLELKSKIDINHKGTIVADVKSTSCKSLADFLRSAEKYDYDRQAAFYLDAVGGKKFVFIVVQKKIPYNIWVIEYHTDSEFIRSGRKKYKALLREWLRRDVRGESFTPSSWASAELCNS